MKIAELFVALGIKAPGVQATLDKVDATLQSAATNASNLVASMTGVQNTLLGLKAAAQQAQQGVAQAANAATTAQVQQTRAQQQAATQANRTAQAQGNVAKNASLAKLEIGKLTAAVTALNAAFVLLMRNALQTGVALKDFALQTGLSTDNLQRWLYYAKQNDVAAADLTETVKGLQTAAADIALGRGNMAPWQLLGISPQQDPFVILDQLRDKLKQMPEGIARTVAQQLGISDKVFQMLLSNMDKLDKRYLINKREQQNLIGLNRAWNELTFKISAFKDKLASAVAVPLKYIVDGLILVIDLIASVYDKLTNLPVVGKFFTSLMYQMGAVLLLVLGLLTALVAALSALKIGMVAWASLAGTAAATTKALAVAVAALKTAFTGAAVAAGVLAAKVAIVLAVIGGVFLIAQDIATYLRGGKSLFGDLVEAMEESRFVKAIVNSLGPLRLMVELIRTARDLLTGKLDFSAWVEKFTPFKLGEGTPKKSVLPEMTEFAATPRLSSSSSSVTQTNNVEVNVDGAQDPKAVGREVTRNFKQTLSEAAYQIPLPSY